MPNLCRNYVLLSHPDATVIKRARDAFSSGRFLQEFVPISLGVGPRHDCDLSSDRWGTKYICDGTCGQITDIDDTTIALNFDSAWAPPCVAYGKLVEQGFDIKATYSEFRACFGGIWCNGCQHHFNWEECEIDFTLFRVARRVIEGVRSSGVPGCEEGQCVCGDSDCPCGREEYELTTPCPSGNCDENVERASSWDLCFQKHSKYRISH